MPAPKRKSTPSSLDTKELPMPNWVKGVLGVQFLVIIFLFIFNIDLRVMPVDMTYSDLVAVLLTGISLLVALLAVFLGVLAFIGWQNFDKRVAQHTEECLNREFSRDGKFYKHLGDIVENLSFSAVSRDYPDLDAGNNDSSE